MNLFSKKLANSGFFIFLKKIKGSLFFLAKSLGEWF